MHHHCRGVPIPTRCGPASLTGLLVGGIAAAVIVLVFELLAAGLYQGALHVTDGLPFTLGLLFEGWDKTQVALAAIVIAIATGIGTLLWYVPGLIVGFLAQFTLLFIVDRHMRAADAIKASTRLVVDHLGGAFVFYGLALVITLLGAALCSVVRMMLEFGLAIVRMSEDIHHHLPAR